MKKKVLAILLTLCLLTGLLPGVALGASTAECDGGESCAHEAAITVGGTTTHYDTLTEALTVASEGQTVALLKDIDNSITKDGYTAGVSYTLKAGATLDGGGHTLSGHISVRIPAAGATVQNVKFENIHNSTMVDQDTCDKYGWTSKTGNQSAIYASDLTGAATITGCTFDNIDWDAIQITPTKTASIVIKDNVFQHTNTTDTQLRYVHVEQAAYSGYQVNELTITDNQFFDTENPNDTVCSVGVWYIEKGTAALKVDGNYIETPATAEVGKLAIKVLYPMRSQPNVDVDDIAPVARDGSEVYSTLQEAIDKTNSSVYMMADAAADSAVIPAGRKINFYPYGCDIGTLTNNGTLKIFGADIAEGSQIINNGTLELRGNAATAYEIENNGTILITSGATYDLSKITGSGSVTITGGTFSTKPDDGLLEKWYIAKEQSGEPVTYKVSKMSTKEAVAVGMVAASGTSGSSLNYYTSVTEGMNITEKYSTVLHTNVDEQVTISTPIEKNSGIRVLNANGYTFTGSITVNDGCGSVRLYGKGNEGEITLTDMRGELLYVGGNTTSANATIQNAQLDILEIVGGGNCTVAGGQYRTVNTEIYYKSGSAYKTPTLSITGGAFASDTVTVKHSNGDPDQSVPLSDYVAEGYTVITGTGAYPYQVVPVSETAAEVVPAAPSVDAPAGAEDLKAAIEAASDLVTGSGLSVAAGTKANENTLTAESTEVTSAMQAAGVTADAGEDVTIVIQPYMDVKIEEVSTEGDSKTLKLDITPKYNVVATTATLTGENPDEIEIGSNAAIVKEAQDLTITQPVTVTIPLPTDFVTDDGANVYVKHTKDGKFVAYHAATYTSGTGSDPDTLTFTNDKGFSTFEVIVDERSAQVTFGDAEQATTLNAANVGEALPVPETPAGQVFDGWKFEGIDGTYKTLTEELLTKLDAAYGDGTTPITATVQFHTPTPAPDPEPEELPFTDVGTDDWFYEAVKYAYDNGMMNGMGDGLFAPGSNLTRGMIAQVFYNLEGKPVVSGESPFGDVEAGQWYADAVNWAAANDIVEGYGNGKFGPKDDITREQMAQILYNYAVFKGYDVSTQGDLSAFNDGEKTSDWALPAMQWAVGTGLMQGYNGNLNPTGTATRAEVAQILMNFHENIVK